MGKEKNRGKFLILDGHSLAYRAFFALPLDLKTKKGLHTNAVLGFTNMLLRLLKTEAPDYIIVTFDYPAPTFRHRVYGEYKATREKTPAEMKEQLPLLKEILASFNIAVSEVEGYEADDLIGTLALKGESAGLDTFIVTADTDAYQLLSSGTRLLITRKGITELEVYTMQKLQEDYGLTPEQWVDFKALKGDSSDNVPGVPGIGEKRALQLLKDYCSLDRILNSLHGIPGKVGKNLSAYAEQALLSKDLVTIKRDAPVALELESCRYKKPDWEKVYRVFYALEFNNLIEKLPALSGFTARKPGDQKEQENKKPVQQFTLWEEKGEGGEGGEGASSAKETPRPGPSEEIEYQGCQKKEEGPIFLDKVDKVEEFSRNLSGVQSFFLQLVNNPGSVHSADGGLICALPEGALFNITLKSGMLLPGRVFEVLEQVFADPAKTLITHDLKPLLKCLTKNGIRLRCAAFDTLLAAYLLEPERPAYHLAVLYEEYMGISIPEPEKGLGDEQRKKQELRFFSRCARNIFALKEILLKGLRARELQELFFQLEMPLVGVLAKMELRGINVRAEVLGKLAIEMDESMVLLEKEIMELAGVDFNLNSPKQLSYILFEHLKLPVIRKIKTGYSTDVKVLQELSAYHPIASKIIEYRTVAKLKSTYLEGLRCLINPQTGKIYTTFNQAVTATGRLSSKDPNLQNIPIRLEAGRRLRYAFRPSREENFLLTADYSQIELRIMAHLSADANLLDAFQRDQDIHRRTAAEVFNVPIDEVTPLMRNRAKAVNFGIIYGISDYGLARDLQIPRAEARKYIEHYFARYPGVKKYVNECIKTAREKGYVTTVMNRRRYLADINHPNFSRRSFAERMARNTPIQGSAADIIKAAMIAIDQCLEEKGFKAAMLLQVHDELIFDVPPEELNEVAYHVKSLMEGILPLSVRLKVDLKAGPDWYNLNAFQGG